MHSITLEVVVKSTAAQRANPDWRAQLTSVLAADGAAVIDVGGGTDLSSLESDNEYEITATTEKLYLTLYGLQNAGYSFTAFDTLTGLRINLD